LSESDRIYVVTPRASDGQSQQPARQDIDAVVNDIRLIVQKAPAEREKAQSGERSLVVSKVEHGRQRVAR